MKIWKKAVSALVTASLLATMTASAAFAEQGTAGQSDQTDDLNCFAAAVISLATCSQVADGISTVTLAGDWDGDHGSSYSYYITATGASIISVAGDCSGCDPGEDFVLTGGIVTAPTGADINHVEDQIVLRAPSAPGSAVVSVYHIDGTTGIATLDGTLTITFTATSGLALSEAKSSVKVGTAPGCATATTAAEADGAPSIFLCVTLKTANNTEANGAVAVTLTPVGLISDDGVSFAQASSEDSVVGYAEFEIKGSGLPGTGTVGISVTQGSTNTPFTPKTVTFTGPLASITATNKIFAMAKDDGSTPDVVRFTAKDAAGNFVELLGATATSSATTILTVTSPADDDFDGASTDVGKISADCAGTAGSATVTVKSGTISSNAVTVYCSGAVATVTVVFSSPTIVPGGTATITVEAKDAGGRPVDDGSLVSAILSAGAATPFGNTSNGKSTATYLAPFNTGVVTALATVGSVNGTGSANVGTTLPGTGTNASALGVTNSGPFDTTTKVAGLSKYVTFKLSFGSGAAGQTVTILRATKTGTTWSAFTAVTSRIADGSGNVYYYVRSSSAAWLSFQGKLTTVLTPARQARWL